ncbi:MAG TPA: DUF459 domain-containing protein [Croceibacterium sp.]
MRFPAALLDRTAVLMLGVAAGSAIGFSFVERPAPAAAPEAASPPALAAQPVAATSVAAAPAPQQLRQTVKQGRPVRIAVFGDSFGEGVAWGLQQQLPRKAGYEVVEFAQPATGFTRYRRLNLEEQAGEQLGEDAVDIAVISFGANDAQGIVTDKGEYAPLMSDKWRDQIGSRIDRFVALVRAHQAEVYWVGLPRMRDAALDGDVGAINRFYAERMATLGVPFIDTRPITSDAEGQYAAHLDDPATGERTLVRAGDGIHMSMTGYKWITRDLTERIRRSVEQARAANEAEAAVVARL